MGVKGGDGGNSDVPSSSMENRAVVRIFSWYVTYRERYGSAIGQGVGRDVDQL